MSKPPKIIKRRITTKEKEAPELGTKILTQQAVNKDPLSPQGIKIEDIDQYLISYFKEQIHVTHNWEKVNFLSFGIQRFNEYFDNKDALNDIVLPLFGITRLKQVEKGTNFNNVESNIPNFGTYTVQKETLLINGKKTVVHYKIPQPLNVNISYDINFITNLQKDIDKINEIFLYLFENSQLYINVKGHYMAVHLENIDNNNKIELDNRRFFNQKYSLLLKGYLINEDRIEKTYGVSNIKLDFKTETESPYLFNISENKFNDECLLTYKFLFSRKTQPIIEISSKHNVNFYDDNQVSSNNYEIYLNDAIKTLPFTANIGDTIKVIIKNIGKRGNIIEIFGKKI